MRRTDTANQRRSNAAYEQANPLTPLNRAKRRQRAFDAASEYFKKYKAVPLLRNLQDIFGIEFFAQATLWLDPLNEFRNSAGIIAGENRLRELTGFKHSGRALWTTTYVLTDNHDPEISHPIPRFIVEESEETHDTIVNDNATEWNSYMWDSTKKGREWERSSASGDQYDINVPSYGTCTIHRVKSEDFVSPNTIIRTSREESHYRSSDYNYYSDGIFTDFVFLDGACTSPSGSIFVDDIDTFALDFMNDNLSRVLPGALASKRTFNLAYQVAELKDLPRLLGDIRNLQQLLKSYLQNPTGSLVQLDKDIASLNLAWEFGVKSLVGAAKGLMQLPEKATKRLNYLIQRNSKVTTGRSSSKWLNYEHDQGLPTFQFLLPDWVEVVDEEVTRNIQVELRCVVDQTIQFPTLAVPSISDFDYLKLVGAVPRVEDLYEILPFTWLYDWFGGMGAYVKIMDAIHSDRQLINYGFLTIVIDEVLTHKAGLKVSSTYKRYRASPIPGDPAFLEEDTSSVRVYPYLKTYTRRFQRRVDISELEGVKGFGWWQSNLSDFQSKILGSLVSQRV